MVPHQLLSRPSTHRQWPATLTPPANAFTDPPQPLLHALAESDSLRGPAEDSRESASLHGTADNSASAPRSSSSGVRGRLLVDDVAWDLLNDVIEAGWLPATSVEARLSSLAEWLALSFLANNRLIEAAPVGVAPTFRGVALAAELAADSS